jgi:predicted transcriptional regulator
MAEDYLFQNQKAFNPWSTVIGITLRMRYRTRTFIVAQILEEAAKDNNGITRTRIIYRAFLSYTQLKSYISILVQSNLLEYQDNDHTYKTTEKGMRFMRIYNQM